MQNDAFADAVAELQRQRADIDREIAQLGLARASIDGQLLGMFRGRDLLVPSDTPTPESPPKTRAVRAGNGKLYRRIETPAAADPLRDDAIEQAAAAAPDKDDAAALDFIARCGDMGAGPGQLDIVHISEDAIDRLTAAGKIEAMDNGRVRAVTATEAEEAAQ